METITRERNENKKQTFVMVNHEDCSEDYTKKLIGIKGLKSSIRNYNL